MSLQSQKEYLIKDFPLLQQLDNQKHPYGSCNLTSVAACAYFFKCPRDGRYNRFPQLEDEMLQRAEDNYWDRHEPGVMKKIAELYGMKDELIIASGWESTGRAMYRAIAHLQKNLPVIFHAYLTTTGHISPCNGVRLSGGKPVQWHFSDPYGEFYPSGYQRNYGGDKSLGKYWLSHDEFTKRVLTGAELWCHLVSR